MGPCPRRMNLAVQHDRDGCRARIGQPRKRRPPRGRGIEAVRARGRGAGGAVTADRIHLLTDRGDADMVQRGRQRRGHTPPAGGDVVGEVGRGMRASADVPTQHVNNASGLGDPDLADRYGQPGPLQPPLAHPPIGWRRTQRQSRACRRQVRAPRGRRSRVTWRGVRTRRADRHDKQRENRAAQHRGTLTRLTAAEGVARAVRGACGR